MSSVDKNASREQMIEKITRSIEEQANSQHKGLRSAPKDKESQDQLGEELIEWASKPTSHYIDEFPLSKGINPYRFYKMRHNNEYFAECLQLAKYFCGLHLKYAVKNKQLNYSYALSLLPLYDPEYKEYLTERVTRAINAHIGEPVSFHCAWIHKEINHERNNALSETDLIEALVSYQDA